MNVLIVGCGHIGRRVADLEAKAGHAVQAWVRTPSSAARVRPYSAKPHTVDLDDPTTFPESLGDSTVIYYFVPPPAHGVTDPRMAHFTAWLSRQRCQPSRIILISTTGVYGDCAGDWITEERPPNPQVDRARRRLAAEETLLDHASRSGFSVVILRVAGIYGPDLLPVARLQRGEPVLRQEESPWSNRIHADDLAAACVAAMHHPHPPAVVNVADGNPSTMTDYFNGVADALGLPRPPSISSDQAGVQLSPGMQSYLAESKRIDNRRLREGLGLTLRYPDLSAGLAEIRSTGVSKPSATE